MYHVVKAFLIWIVVFGSVIGMLWWGNTTSIKRHNQVWEQFLQEHFCKIVAQKPDKGFFDPPRTTYHCDDDFYYHRKL
ncbi:MAG: hypothetical protein J6P29_05800 [Acetobacter sp.]|nr:hypothetical protein [Acetobacter sp.]